MTIKHHLSQPLLIAYAAGNLPEAFGIAVASHISMCDDCRAAFAACEAVGGAVLQGANGAVALTEGALEACLARLGDAQPQVKPPAPRHPVLPAPLTEYVGTDLAKIKWRSLGMGVRQAILPTKDEGGSARLLYIPAGQSVPDHGHRGMELTLVLQGAFHDETDRFARGDIEIASEADQHTPIAETGADCICLAVTDAPLRFSGLIPRLLQPMFRI